MASLFEDASLVMIPSGYKDGKVYSIKPTNGDGDLTFTRSNDTATRVGPDGLIEKVRTNLLTYSNTFSDASWSKLAASVTGGQTGYDGLSNAWLLENNSGTFTTTRLQQNLSASSSLYTFSIYAKAGTTDIMRILIYDGATSRQSWFNFTLGSFSNTASLVSTFTESVGGGWYRLSITAQSVLVSAAVYPSAASGSSFADAGDNILIQASQVETGDIATDYIATTTAAVSVGPVANLPRLDYLDSSCPKLLLEPQKTNSVVFSEQFDNAAYTKSETSVTANAIVSPDGNTSADFIIPSVTSGLHSVSLGGASVSSGTHTLSVFAKKGVYKNLLVWLDGHSGGVGVNLDTLAVFRDANNSGYKIEDYGNGWVRISVTCTVVVSSPPNFYIYDNSATPVISWAGNGTDGLYMWGAQLEAGSYSTSYIPTLSAASTRGADDALKTGISSLIGQTEGVVFLDFEIQNPISAQTSDPVLWYMKDGSGGERYVELYSTGDLVYVEVAASVIANIQKTGLTVGRHKCAVAYAPNDMTFFVDGIQIGTSTSGTPNGYSTFALQYYSTTYTGQQMVNQALLFKTRLTNAELAALTTL